MSVAILGIVVTIGIACVGWIIQIQNERRKEAQRKLERQQQAVAAAALGLGTLFFGFRTAIVLGAASWVATHIINELPLDDQLTPEYKQIESH